MRGLQRRVPPIPPLRLITGRLRDIPLAGRIPAVRRAHAEPAARPVAGAPGRVRARHTPLHAQPVVDQARRIRTVRHAAAVDPVDLVPDLEARILHGARHAMIRARRREREHMPARLQRAIHEPPELRVERYPRPVERPVHEIDLIRRVRHARVRAPLRKPGQHIPAVAVRQPDPMVEFDDVRHRPCVCVHTGGYRDRRGRSSSPTYRNARAHSIPSGRGAPERTGTSRTARDSRRSSEHRYPSAVRTVPRRHHQRGRRHQAAPGNRQPDDHHLDRHAASRQR